MVDGKHLLTDESEMDFNACEGDGKKKVEPGDWDNAADMSTPKLQCSGSGNQASVAQVPDSDISETNGRKKYSRDILLSFAHQCSGLPHGIQMNTFTGALFKGFMSYVIDREPRPSPGRGSERTTSRGDRRCATMDDGKWTTKSGVPLSPVTPMQIMHKAEEKYVVGKVSDEEQAKKRQLKAILNKLTPENFDKLFEQVKEMNIDNVSTLTGVISQIFDKALMEQTFCEMYANFCFHLAGALPDFSEGYEKITFKTLLLKKCQDEFERGRRLEAEADKTQEKGEVKRTKEQSEEKRVKARRRMLGNIRLIGELYKKGMLTERIMHDCIKSMLGHFQNPDEENIEALCKLMSTIGEMIDHPKAKEHMDAYFDVMCRLSASQLISSRVRFLLRDSIDLRRNKWQQRRKVEGPKKIDEVHRDAAQERHAQLSSLARGPVISPGSRGSAAILVSPGAQQPGRGFGNQDIRFEFDNRTVPLPRWSVVRNEVTTLAPQCGLARGDRMSLRGQPPVSNAELPSVVDHRTIVYGSNGTGYSSVASNAREDTSSRIPDRISWRKAPATQSTGSSHRPASQDGSLGNKSDSGEDLRGKSTSAFRYYRENYLLDTKMTACHGKETEKQKMNSRSWCSRNSFKVACCIGLVLVVAYILQGLVLV